MRMKKQAAEPLDVSIELFKAFADPVRLRLLNLLADGEVCVCHLHEALDLPQSTVSRHLAYLRKRGLVVGRKEGLWVHYRLAKPAGELHRTSDRLPARMLQGDRILEARPAKARSRLLLLR